MFSQGRQFKKVSSGEWEVLPCRLSEGWERREVGLGKEPGATALLVLTIALCCPRV